MKSRSILFSGLVVLVPLTGVFAADNGGSPPPGPVQPSSSTNAQPATPAPAQANTTAKSAPGAAAPNGSNGATPSGTTVTKTSNTPSKPNSPATPPPAPSPASKPVATILDNYLKDLGEAFTLSDNEKKAIQSFYLADGILLKNVLNNDSVSPLQQAQQVSDLRDTRNAKIEALLEDVDRQQEFLKVEAHYRVALTELAADGGLIPAGAVPPVAAPTQTPPGKAEPIPETNKGNAQ